MKKNHVSLQLEKNTVVDEGNGLITVKGGLTLTDGSIQHNGTRYDIESLDISDYDGKLFADHGDGWGGYPINTIIGKLIGVTKNSRRVVAKGIQYFMDNPLGMLAYNGTAQGFLTDFSIGTMGAEPDEGLFKNHSLFETSQVGMGNNKNAKLNELVVNSIKQAKESGLDTSELEKVYKVNEIEEKKEVEEDKKPDVEVKAPTEEKEEVAQVDVEATVNSAIEKAVKPLKEELNTYKDAFDKGAKEPEFTLNTSAPTVSGGVKGALDGMDYRDLHTHQIELARQMLVTGSKEAASKLSSINGFLLDKLKEKGLVRNTITIADMGNFVISPELLTEIQGCRTSYASLISATDWRETLSTRMAWLSRSGDIDMQEVGFCEDSDGSVGADDNLKPISQYGAELKTSDLSEVAAVTPVCNAATRFLAVDVLGDVAAGYRNDYDRKRAQLVIARLQQAIDNNGNEVSYDLGTPQDALTSFLDTFGEISTCTPNGTYLLSDKSLLELQKQIIKAGGSDVFNQVFFKGENGVPTINNRPYIVLPSDLLPTLGTNETKTFVVDGTSVTVDDAVFYFDLSNFTGRISGGLQYDLSTQASYEDGGKVKSAFQRNEIVLRGSFFRGGAIKDEDQVSALQAPATS